jgi:hypothetical protein
MSRYILSFFAIVIAISLAAFTKPESPKRPLTDYFFAFDIAHNAPTQQNVEDPSKWMQVSDLSGCDNLNEKACTIEVPSTTTNAGSPRTLKSTTEINSQQFTTGVYYVVPGGSVVDESNSEE